MSLEDLGIIGGEDEVESTLLIDGDIVIYQPCCIFNEDTDYDRIQIKKHINNKIDKMLADSGCTSYMMFVTTKINFRDDLVDDYKANRVDVDRPVNLVWAKKWSLAGLNCFFENGLEADDLLGIYTNDDTVIWSLDKDLRQIPGRHLDDKSGTVVEVSEEGTLRVDKYVTEAGNAKEKTYFDGAVGLHYQMLVGDSTDNIIGCGKREPKVYKSGPNKGQSYTARKGVGNKTAVKLLTKAALNSRDKTVQEATLQAVVYEYKKLHGNDWQQHLETQANLLFMVRQKQGRFFRRWTYDGRKEYFNLDTGKILTRSQFLHDTA